MSYLVLARKYRPQQFEDVTGQEHVTQTLVNAIEQQRVHHAFLFTGARGVGKTTCARLLAKALNCHAGPTGKPCYACPSCEEITNGSSVDVFEVDGASNRGIDEIRELRENVKYAPSRDRYKIYIIDEVHMLTEAAFNALLKTLEEPPPHVKFIFATTEPRKIPVTILSRCQRFDFKRIPPRALTARLQGILDAEHVKIDPAALALVVREAEGTARDALSLLDQAISFCGLEITYTGMLEVLGLADRSALQEMTEALLQRDATHVLELIDRVHGYGHDLGRFAAELLQHLRDLAVIRTSRAPAGLVQMAPAEADTLARLVAPVDPGHLRRMFFVMLEGVREISRSSFPKLVLEMTLLRMVDLAPPLQVEPLVKRLEQLEQRLAQGGPAPSPDGPRRGEPGGGSGGPPPTPASSGGTPPATPGGRSLRWVPPDERGPAKPAPAATARPVPQPAPEPSPVVRAVEPQPVAVPVPLVPVPDPTPRPVPPPEPVPLPLPVPVIPLPEPARPEPLPEPLPLPVPVPEPVPVVPLPTPRPGPEPLPEPPPRPVVPRPTPLPGPEPPSAADPAAGELPSRELYEGWHKLVQLMRRESPTLGNALARARLLPSAEGVLLLGYPDASAASDQASERLREVESFTGPTLGCHAALRLQVGFDPRSPSLLSVYEEEERIRQELLESRRNLARNHPLVQAIQLELEGTIQEIRAFEARRENRR